MGFVRRIITSALDLANLAKHNANFADIETDLTDHNARIGAAQGDITTHKASTSAHAAETITYSGAVSTADTVKEAIDSVKTELTQAIIAGDSGPEAAAARASVSGTVYDTLGDRLNTEFSGVTAQLADILLDLLNYSKYRKGALYNKALAHMIANMSPKSLRQFNAALASGTVKVAIAGDSISEGDDQTNFNDNYAARVIRDLRTAYPSVSFTFTNFSLSGRALANFVSPTYKDYSDSYPDRAHARKWLTDTNKVWRTYVEDFAPDLLIVAFGVNDTTATKANGHDRDGDFIAALNNTLVPYINGWSKVPSLCLVTSLLTTTKTSDSIPVFGFAPSEVVTQATARAVRHYAQDYGFALADANRLWLLLRDGSDDVNRASTWERNAEGLSSSKWIGDKSSFGLSGVRLTQNTAGKYVTRTRLFFEGSVEADIVPRSNGAAGNYVVAVRSDDDLGKIIWTLTPSSANGTADGTIKIESVTPSYGTMLIASQTGLTINTGTSYNLRLDSIGSKHTAYIGGNQVLTAALYNCMHDGQVTIGSNTTAPYIDNLILSYEDPLKDSPVYYESDLLGVTPYNDKSSSGDGIHHPTGLGHSMAYSAAFLPLLSHCNPDTPFICEYARISSVPIPAGAGGTAVNFDFKVQDLVGMKTSATEYTIPTTGTYNIGLYMEWDFSSSANDAVMTNIEIYRGGLLHTFRDSQKSVYVSGEAVHMDQIVSLTKLLQAGDKIVIKAQHLLATSYNLLEAGVTISKVD